MKEDLCHICGGIIDNHFHIVNDKIVSPRSMPEFKATDSWYIRTAELEKGFLIGKKYGNS